MERRFRITVDGTPYDVTVEDLTDTGNLLYPQPGSMAVPSVPSTAPAPAAPPVAVAASGDIVATLGGVVESVLVQAGQVVAQVDDGHDKREQREDQRDKEDDGEDRHLGAEGAKRRSST